MSDVLLTIVTHVALAIGVYRWATDRERQRAARVLWPGVIVGKLALGIPPGESTALVVERSEDGHTMTLRHRAEAWDAEVPARVEGL